LNAYDSLFEYSLKYLGSIRGVFCGAGVSPAIFGGLAQIQNRRRDAGATNNPASLCKMVGRNIPRPESKIS